MKSVTIFPGDMLTIDCTKVQSPTTTTLHIQDDAVIEIKRVVPTLPETDLRIHDLFPSRREAGSRNHTEAWSHARCPHCGSMSLRRGKEYTSCSHKCRAVWPNEVADQVTGDHT